MKSGQITDGKKFRFDSGSHTRYPSCGDTRGRARVTLAGRSYYFGQYGAPESYVMYGAWLAQLLRTGKAYKASERREDALDFIGEGQVKRPTPKPWIAAGMLASAMVMTIGAVSCAWIISSYSAPRVDDVAMTVTELEYVRTIRNLSAKKGSYRSADRVADTYQKAMQGLLNASPPRISAKPPIKPLD